MESAASISWSRQTYIDPVSIYSHQLLLVKIVRTDCVSRNQLPLLRLREPSRNGRLRQDGQARRLPSRRPAQLRGLAHRHRREERQPWRQASILIIPPIPRITLSSVLRIMRLAPSCFTTKNIHLSGVCGGRSSHMCKDYAYSCMWEGLRSI